MNAMEIVLGVVASISFAYFLVRRYSHQSSVFDHREKKPIESIFREFFPQSAAVPLNEFEMMWCKVASILHVHPEQLRPTDRFDSEFKPIPNDGRDDRLIQLSHFAQTYGIDQQVEDVAEYLRLLLSPKVSKKPAAGVITLRR